jgi:hypothetical protein
VHELGRVIAALHRATATFAAPPDAHWQFMVGAPQLEK